MISLRKALCVLALTLLTGCWDQVELTERGFVMGVAIDLSEEGKIELTSQIYKPMQTSGGGEGQPVQAFVNIRSVQNSVLEAVREIPSHLGRKAQWSHQRIVLLSEAYVRKYGIQDVIDFFNRDIEPRLTSNVFITKGRAGAYLERTPMIESTTGQELKRIQESAARNSAKTIEMNLLDLNKSLRSPTGNAVVPYIGLDATLDSSFAIKGIALLEQGKLKATLSSARTEYLMMLLGKFQFAVIQIPCTGQAGLVDGLNNSLESIGSHTRMKTHASPGNIRVEIFVTITGALGEIHCVDVSTPEGEAAFVAEAEDNITKGLQSLVQELQDKKLDVLGIGNRIYQQDPKLWNSLRHDWGDTFQRTKFTYHVQINLVNTEMHTGSPGIESK